ncbi:MAG: hypothetical protein ACC669_05640 [bacterium]
MKRLFAASLAIFTVLLGSQPVWALGTPVGTPISNRATASYTINSVPLSASSVTVTTTVDELINATVTWQDANTVNVTLGAADQPLTYRVTNTGNGTESFVLAEDVNLVTDDFDPVFVSLYVDNGDGIYDSTVDSAYGSSVTVAADGWATIFMVNDIPGAGLSDGDIGSAQLTATSTNAVANTTPGTVIAGGGDGGVDAVIGATGGFDSAIGSYQVFITTVSLTKSAVVSNAFGGTQPIPGATISYSILISVNGSGQASSFVFTDQIPTNTTYSPGTLSVVPGPAVSATVGGVPISATVDFGTLDSGSTPQTVNFDVTID